MRSDLYRNISAENSVDDAEEEIPIPQDEFLKNRRIRVLTFTSLFPNRIQPRHGIFVETRLRNLISDFNVDARIISPVPWFPFRSRIFGRYHKYALTDLQDIRAGELPVSYPRYLVIPRVGINFQPDSMARSARGLIRQFLTSGWRPDVIDAHYFYPDGVAAAILANEFDIPLMITARGTDVNVIGRIPGPAKRILWASKVASSVVAVSDRLRDNLVAIGVDESKIVVLRNGVDLRAGV